MKRVSDLIYRHEAIRTMTSYNGTVDKSVAKRLLLQMPSAEPEIVRCKDCKWGRKVSGNIECFVDSNIPPEYHGYGWFCPNGER